MSNKSAAEVSSMAAFRKRKVQSKNKKKIAIADAPVTWDDAHKLAGDLSGIITSVAEGTEQIRMAISTFSMPAVEVKLKDLGIKGYILNSEFTTFLSTLAAYTDKVTEDDFPTYYDLMHTLASTYTARVSELTELMSDIKDDAEAELFKLKEKEVANV